MPGRQSKKFGGLCKSLPDLVSGRLGFWIQKLFDSKTRFYKTSLIYSVCLEFWDWGYPYHLTLCCFSVRVVFLRQPRLNLPKLRITLPSQLSYYESWPLWPVADEGLKVRPSGVGTVLIHAIVCLCICSRNIVINTIILLFQSHSCWSGLAIGW